MSTTSLAKAGSLALSLVGVVVIGLSPLKHLRWLVGHQIEEECEPPVGMTISLGNKQVKLDASQGKASTGSGAAGG